MKTRASAVLACFAAVLLAYPCKPQGGTPHSAGKDAGLRISITVDHKHSKPMLVVAVSNESDKDWIFPLGYTYAGHTHPVDFSILLTRKNGVAATVLYTGVGGIEGRVDPAFTTLLRGSTYVLRMPTSEYVVVDTNQLLNEVAGSGASLQMQYSSNGKECPQTLDGRGNPTLLSCWASPLISNAVRY